MAAGGEEKVRLGACASAYVGEKIVVGLSGGRDSVALLLLLLETGARVIACHVHHGIRGGAADGDADFCRELCERLGVKYAEARVDVPGLAAESGESLETVARRERRAVLCAVARAESARVIALAHHADDQAETVLFQMGRGTASAHGMAAEVQAEGLVWIRPLLELRRADLTVWLEQRGEPWVDDATNAVPDVSRNRLRLEVLPAYCAAMGRDVVPVINRSAEMLGETQAALTEAIAALPVKDPQGRLYLPWLMSCGTALRRAVLHRYLAECGVPELSRAMVLRVEEILPAGAEHSRLDLPGGFRAVRAHKRLSIQRR